jgi:hypothetical protein
MFDFCIQTSVCALQFWWYYPCSVMSKYVHCGSEHPVECFANELQYLYVVIPLSTPRIFRSWLLKCLLLNVLAVHCTRQLTTCLLSTACLICIVHCPRLPIIKISPAAPLVCRLYSRMPGRLEGVSTRIVQVLHRVIHLKTYSNRNVFYWSLLFDTKHMDVHWVMEDLYSMFYV